MSAALQTARAARDNAKATLDAAETASSELLSRRHFLQREITEAQTRRSRAAVADLIGEEVSTLPDEDAMIAKLERELAASAEAETILATRRQNAEERSKEATKQFATQAQTYVTGQFIDPARARVSCAFDELRDALIKLGAAHYVAHKENASSEAIYNRPIADWYGPACDFLDGLVRGRVWSAWPYSIRPDWLPTTGPSTRIWELEGFEEEVQRVRTGLVEAA